MNKEKLNILLDRVYELEGLVHLGLAREDCPESLLGLIARKAEALRTLAAEAVAEDVVSEDGDSESISAPAEIGKEEASSQPEISEPADQADVAISAEEMATEESSTIEAVDNSHNKAEDSQEHNEEVVVAEDAADVKTVKPVDIDSVQALQENHYEEMDEDAASMDNMVLELAEASSCEQEMEEASFEAYELPEDAAEESQADEKTESIAKTAPIAKAYPITEPVPIYREKPLVKKDELVSAKSVEPRGRLVFTINDRYRFKRDLFCNSDAEFNTTLALVASMDSYEEAENYFLDELQWNLQRQEVADFLDILKNYFKD